MRSVHITFICTIVLPFCLFSQSESHSILVKTQRLLLSDLITQIENQSDYFFTYNENQIPLLDSVSLEEEMLNGVGLNRLLNYICNSAKLDFELEENSGKILLSPAENILLSGRILDSLSFESIIGATIFIENQALGVTNKNGYFSLSVPRRVDKVFIQNLGYNVKAVSLEFKVNNNLTVYLSSNIDFEIIITPENTEMYSGTQTFDVNDIVSFKGIGGTDDVLAKIKSLPGVSVGSEGQNGFMVRGGGPYQNLILIDGMPIYEGSHLGGLSSIFLSSAVKNIDFYKSGFPARYGGKLSGVLDVHLKEGNRNKYERKLTVGLEGVTGHIDGPLGPQTSINLNGKFSWFSLLAEPIVKSVSDIEKIRLGYNDSYAKITHWFKEDHQVSLSAYIGNDLVQLQRNSINHPNSSFSDFNRIEWGNALYAIDWSIMIKPNLFFTSNLGSSSYNYRSHGTYQLFFNNSEGEGSRVFDILSTSNIRDFVVTPRIDWHSSVFGSLSLGLNYIGHKNEPSIIESEQYSPIDNPSTIADTTYLTNEMVAFVENSFYLSPQWMMNTGMRFNWYLNGNSTYFYPQPRLNLRYQTANTQVDFSYSRLSQFTHLLSNPGLGLPSDLWVPSTDNVPPELSNNVSVDLKKTFKLWSYGVSVFYKDYDNLIEYSNPFDILYSFIIDNDLFQVEVDNSNWEERVSLGKGSSVGLELYGRLKTQQWQTEFSYTLSNSQRQFLSIDNGESFQYKFDSPHNISASISYKLDRHKTLVFNWAFANGNRYTLADERQPGPDGTEFLVAPFRNNAKLQNFHHLDVHYRLQKSFENGREVYFDFGVYNIYNRKNPFYEYLLEGDDTERPEISKISIFPLLPQLNVTWVW